MKPILVSTLLDQPSGSGGVGAVDLAIQSSLAAQYAQIIEQREEICRAFIAQHGCWPDQAMQITASDPVNGGTRWWVTLKHRVDPDIKSVVENLANQHNAPAQPHALDSFEHPAMYRARTREAARKYRESIRRHNPEDIQ